MYYNNVYMIYYLYTHRKRESERDWGGEGEEEYTYLI